jgi:voltage-gated potassium channel
MKGRTPASLLLLVEVVLAVYSVVVFATLAGALGAYFLERRNEREEAG